MVHTSTHSWFDLRRFEGEGSAGTATETGTGETGTGTGESGSAGETGEAGTGEATPRSFTQAELDKIVSDRLKRQAAQYSGHEDLKKKAAEYDKLQEAQKTALQKEQERAEAAEKKAADAETRANRALIRAAVVAEATKLRAISPEDVLAVLEADSVTIGDDGEPTGVAEAVRKALDARPHWVDDGKAHGSGDGGARTGGAPADFRTADRAALAAELGKHGLQPRTW